MEKNCLNCGAVFTKKPSDSKSYWAIKKYCSIKCSNTTIKKGQQLSPATQFVKGQFVGSSNPRWKGGRRKSSQGYIEVLVGVKKYQLEHRFVIEQHLGRKLLLGEQVHHLNGIKTDNRLENLQLVNSKSHGQVHANQRWHNQPVEVL